jgi:hypothetical protein
MSIGGILLGLINIAIVIAILLLAGALIEWAFSSIAKITIPDMIRKIYLLIVALVAIYMIVELLLTGVPSRFPFHAGAADGVAGRSFAAIATAAAPDLQGTMLS